MIVDKSEKMFSKGKTAIALGSFDGLHKGHMAVIACALGFKERGLVPTVLLFDSHPLLTLKGTAPTALLQPALRNDILDKLGVKTVTLSFGDIFHLQPREFFEQILVKKLNAGAVCCGENYRFGAGGSGNIDVLKDLCNEFSVEMKTAASQFYGSELISSSKIRHAVQSGNITAANAMLGRKFGYINTVDNGAHRGRLIGSPTINQHFDKGFTIAKIGVYASETVVNGTIYPSVTNIGLRPSFENEDLRSETCILGFSGDLYGKDIEVRLVEYIRDEMSFNSLDALSGQIKKDAEKSKNIFMRGEHNV